MTRRPPRHARGARLPHAGGVGAARRHLARLAARAQRLAGPGQARGRSAGSTPRSSGTSSPGERVRILVQDDAPRASARRPCSGAPASIATRVDFVPHPDRPRLDARLLPALRARRDGRRRRSIDWQFNGWAKYPNHKRDDAVADRIARRCRLRQWQPARRRSAPRRVVLEGGASTSTAAARCSRPRSACSAPSRRAIPGSPATELEQRARRPPRRPQGALARRAASPATTRTATSTTWRASSTRAPSSSPSSDDPADDELRAACATTATASRDMTDQDGAPLRVVDAADAGAARLRRPAPAGELRQLLHRQRRRARADVQRSGTTGARSASWPSCSPPAASSASTPSTSCWGLGTLHCMTQQEPAEDASAGDL